MLTTPPLCKQTNQKMAVYIDYNWQVCVWPSWWNTNGPFWLLCINLFSRSFKIMILVLASVVTSSTCICIYKQVLIVFHLNFCRSYNMCQGWEKEDLSRAREDERYVIQNLVKLNIKIEISTNYNHWKNSWNTWRILDCEWHESALISRRTPCSLPAHSHPLNQCWGKCADWWQHVWDQHCHWGFGVP